MILEHAVLSVRPGQETAFEAALAQARPLIASSAGFASMTVRRDAEGANRYLLLVEWADIASHREGFRRSDRYQAWRGLLHPFYDPMPIVGYFGEPL